MTLITLQLSDGNYVNAKWKSMFFYISGIFVQGFLHFRNYGSSRKSNP